MGEEVEEGAREVGKGEGEVVGEGGGGEREEGT